MKMAKLYLCTSGEMAVHALGILRLFSSTGEKMAGLSEASQVA